MGEQRDYGDENNQQAQQQWHCEGGRPKFFGRDMTVPAKAWVLTDIDRRFLRGLRISQE